MGPLATLGRRLRDARRRLSGAMPYADDAWVLTVRVLVAAPVFALSLALLGYLSGDAATPVPTTTDLLGGVVLALVNEMGSRVWEWYTEAA